ncbi:MAG: hypothetical protein MK135_00630 [Polyangiaceae bacterium]|nr:hypothetical protein [Polyangiaceae bacterium]
MQPEAIDAKAPLSKVESCKRVVRRLLLSGENSSPKAAVRDGDEIYVIGTSPHQELPKGHLTFKTTLPAVDQTLMLRLNQWAESECCENEVVLRATLRSQVPFLTDLGMRMQQIAHQATVTLQDLHAEAALLDGLSAEETIVLKSYFLHQGTSVEENSATKRKKCAKKLLRFPRPYLERSLRWVLSKTLPEPQKFEVLISALQVNATRAIIPVAKELRNQGQTVGFLVRYRDRISQSLLKQEGFSWNFAEAGSKKNTSSIKRARRELRELPEKIFEDLTQILNLPTWLSTPEMVNYLRSQTLGRAKATLEQAYIYDEALRATESRACIYITHRALFDELLRQPDLEQVRILFLQGLTADIPPTATTMKLEKAIVGSQLDLEYIRRCGLSEEKIAITGYADYDHFRSLKPQESEANLRKAHPQAQGRPIVVFTSQYATPIFPDWARQKNLETMVETAEKMPEVFFILRLHPLKEKIPPALLNRLPANAVFSNQGSTPEAIQGAHALVTFWSTTALEAILLNTPLIQLNATGLPDFLDLSSESGQSFVRHAKDLALRLRTLIHQGDQEILAKQHEFCQRHELIQEAPSAPLAADIIRAAIELKATRQDH